MSIASTTRFCEVVHNPCVGIKHDQAHNPETLAGRLQIALDLRDVNPNKVEIATGISRQTLYAVLNGKTDHFLHETLVVVCDYLGVRPTWLADGELPMYPPPVLSEEEVELISSFRAMSASHRRDLADIAQRWAGEDDPNHTADRGEFGPRPTRQ